MDSKKLDFGQHISDVHTSQVNEGRVARDLSRPEVDSELRLQPQELPGEPEGRVSGLEIQLQQKENEIQSLKQRLSDLEVSATQARIANETLTYYLERYKRVKDRFLPPGSFRERVCRQIAPRILARRAGDAQPQPRPSQQPRAVRSCSVVGSTTGAEIVI